MWLENVFLGFSISGKPSSDTKAGRKKQLSESTDKSLTDNKKTRSILREDYNSKLDQYRREHEEKLQKKREQRKKEKLLRKQQTAGESAAAESEPSPADIDQVWSHPFFYCLSEDNLRMNCSPDVLVWSGAPQEAVEWVFASQETLTKLTRSTQDR